MKKQTRLIDIANALGISKVAVSVALSNNPNSRTKVSKETILKVKEMAMRMDYKPNIIAKTLAGRASHVIGVVIDRNAPISRFKILSQIENEANKLGYRCMIGETHNSLADTHQNIVDFRQHGVDGVICLAHAYPGTENQFSELFDDVLPYTIFLGRPNHPDATYLYIDHSQSIFCGVKHLYQQGSRRIALVQDKNSWPTATFSEQGYNEALNFLVDPNLPNLICKVSFDNHYTLNGLTKIVEYITEYIIEKKVDAILGINDFCALALIKKLTALNIKVPQDVKIIGKDNELFSHFCQPSLTTIDENSDIIAQNCITLLTKKINNNNDSLNGCQKTLYPKLIIRESSCCVNNITKKTILKRRKNEKTIHTY